MLSQYRIVGKLGAGGMGVVVRAEDEALERPVALKFLSGKSFGDEQLRARFLREARVIAGLNHPNVCTIHAIGEVQPGEELTLDTGEKLVAGTPFIALELLDGETLGERLMQPERMPIDEILSIAIAVADGLAAAHAKGLMHRDLKPDNVMVTTDGQVKILDFGLAKPVVEPKDPDQVMTRAAEESAQLTMQGMIVGTIAYMSPEQAQGKDLDARSDVFSFGVMLHEMIAGKRPFEGDTAAATLAKIIESAPAPLVGTRPDLPHDLERMVSRCLRKPPAERFHDVRDLVVGLKDLQRDVSSGPVPLASGPVEARDATATEATTPSGTNRGVLVIAALLVMVAVGFAAWAAGQNPGEGTAAGGDETPSRETTAPVTAPEPATFTQLTFDGNALAPAISPDGRSLAYLRLAMDGRGDARLIVRDIDTGSSIELAQAKGMSAPSWSPDGTKIAFGIYENDGFGAAIIPRLGGAMRRFSTRGPQAMAWSADGSRLISLGEVGGSSGLTIVDARTLAAEDREIAGLGRPPASLDWSADARYVLLTDLPIPGEASTIRVLDLETKELSTLVSEFAALYSAQWASDEGAVYFIRRAPGEAGVVLRAELDSTRTRIVGEPRTAMSNFPGTAAFELSADGARGVYLRAIHATNLWTVTLDVEPSDSPLPATQITRGTATHWGPVVSPDGERVAFIRDRPGGGVGGLFVATLDGDDPRQLSFSKRGAQHGAVVWSLDGERIYFAEFREASATVFSVPATGGQPEEHGAVKWVNPQFCRPIMLVDGRIVARDAGINGRFVAFDPATGKTSTLLESVEGESLDVAVVSADGQSLVLVRSTADPASPRNGTFVHDLGTGAERRVSSETIPIVGFAADGTGVIVCGFDAAPRRVHVVHGGGTDPTLVGTLPSEFGLVAQLTASRDGTTCVAAVVDVTVDIWLAENWDATRARTE